MTIIGWFVGVSVLTMILGVVLIAFELSRKWHNRR